MNYSLKTDFPRETHIFIEIIFLDIVTYIPVIYLFDLLYLIIVPLKFLASARLTFCFLQIGDQILDVNGTSFLDISHDNAVEHLKKHKRMTITIRDVGKIPHSISTFDSNPTVDCTYR